MLSLLLGLLFRIWDGYGNHVNARGFSLLFEVVDRYHKSDDQISIKKRLNRNYIIGPVYISRAQEPYLAISLRQ